MKTVYTTLLAAVIAASLGCGYNSKKSAPMPGVMPTVSQLNPNSVTAGSAAFTLTVDGTNFGSSAVVNWNNAAQSTSFVSSNQLTVAIPASMIAISGSVQITVTNPGTSGMGLYGGGGTLPETSTPATLTIQ
jgi:hypothetical protein